MFGYEICKEKLYYKIHKNSSKYSLRSNSTWHNENSLE